MTWALMQSEDQRLAQLVGDCMLSFTTGIVHLATEDHVPAAWQVLPQDAAYSGKLNPLGVRPPAQQARPLH